MIETDKLRASSQDIQASALVWCGQDVMLYEFPVLPYSWPGTWGNA